jgi:hypothetical protein
MDPFVIAALASSALALGASVIAVWRKKNHVHDDLRKQLDEALEENVRLIAESKAQADALHHAKTRATSESLDEHAKRAVAYAEQLGGTGKQKLAHALGASIKFDRDSNGQQDWTDAQHRIAIEAALARR